MQAPVHFETPLSKFARVLGALALICAMCGAACTGRTRARSDVVEATSSRVDIFLRCVDPAARAVSFELETLELRDENGQLRKLDVTREWVRSDDTEQRTRIAGAVVAPANYSALVLTLRGAWLERPDGRIALSLEGEGPTCTVELPIGLRVESRQAASLFIDWRVGASLLGGTSFQPAFTVAQETPQTALALLYVADEATSSVLSIDRATGQIVGTFKTGAQPRALALGRDRRLLWAANSGDGSVSALDTRQGNIESTVGIAFGAGTCDLVFADDGRWLAAANRALGSIALIATGGSTMIEVEVGTEPVRLAAAPRLRRVYTANAGSDSVSVVDVNSRRVVATVSTESQPSALDVDGNEEELFVGHATSPNLLVFDAETLAPLGSLFIGADVTDVLADRRRGRVYVARARPPEIVVVDRRLGSADPRLDPAARGPGLVVRRIALSSPVTSMVQSREGTRLYAAAPDAGAVLVIDVVLGKEEPAIRCGSRPSDVVLAD